MNKLIKLLSGAVAGVALAAVVSLAGNVIGNNVADAATSSCVTTNGGITVNKVNANAFARIQGACGQHHVQMKSYYAQSATGQPHTGQVKYQDGAIQTLKSGGSNNWVKFNVSMPDNDNTCYYQVDLVDLDTTAPDGHGNFVVASKTGGDHDCTPDTKVHAYACSAFQATPDNPNHTATVTTFTQTTTNATYLGSTIYWNYDNDKNDVTQSVNVTGESHPYAADGTYNIVVIAHFSYTGQFGKTHYVDAAPCGQKVTFVTPPPHVNYITVCKIDTKEFVTIDESLLGTSQYPASNYTQDFSKCVVRNINVCKIDTKDIVTIDESLLGTAQYPASNYTTDLSKCIPTVTPPPVTPPTTPPTKLVNTGPGSVVAIAGVAGIAAAAAHAFWRRRTV